MTPLGACSAFLGAGSTPAGVWPVLSQIDPLVAATQSASLVVLFTLFAIERRLAVVGSTPGAIQGTLVRIGGTLGADRQALTTAGPIPRGVRQTPLALRPIAPDMGDVVPAIGGPFAMTGARTSGVRGALMPLGATALPVGRATTALPETPRALGGALPALGELALPVGEAPSVSGEILLAVNAIVSVINEITPEMGETSSEIGEAARAVALVPRRRRRMRTVVRRACTFLHPRSEASLFVSLAASSSAS